MNLLLVGREGLTRNNCSSVTTATSFVFRFHAVCGEIGEDITEKITDLRFSLDYFVATTRVDETTFHDAKRGRYTALEEVRCRAAQVHTFF